MDEVPRNPGVILGTQDHLAQAINTINTRLAHLEESVGQISINREGHSMSVNRPKATTRKALRTEKGQKKKVENSSDSDETKYSEPSATNSGEDDSDPETEQGSRRRNQGQR